MAQQHASRAIAEGAAVRASYWGWFCLSLGPLSSSATSSRDVCWFWIRNVAIVNSLEWVGPKGLRGSWSPAQQHSVAFLVLSRHMYSNFQALAMCRFMCWTFLKLPCCMQWYKTQHNDCLKGPEWAFFILSPPQDFCSACSETWIKIFLHFLPLATPQKAQAWGMTCTTRKTLLREAGKSRSCSTWEITWRHLLFTFLLKPMEK